MREIKDGNANSMGKLTDRSKVSAAILEQARSIKLWNPETNSPSDFGLTLEQKAYMNLGNSPVQIHAFGWLRDYFATIGDYQPNASEEIHLDAIEKKEIYDEYVRELSFEEDLIKNAEFAPLGYPSFVELWERCFS